MLRLYDSIQGFSNPGKKLTSVNLMLVSSRQTWPLVGVHVHVSGCINLKFEELTKKCTVKKGKKNIKLEKHNCLFFQITYSTPVDVVI